ncbi:polyprenyl synthetase family protein [Legionella londiniensis]|uniref:Geranyltranstransferase n=1 Tax=Legionella londiniensis TaxID=45068 RepID=A0A0W0VP77_9GAMM|nr:polyprenyl synthetase family protein [Legionella londiniensis]KTD21911.1 geranyltranstransferase [Legionella londiniensis]STX92606.1 geranyltranstransferase [Legionella londiniensis]
MNNTFIDYYITRHEQLLQDTIDALVIPSPRLKEGIGYSLFPGGKRLRPLLVYLCGELVSANMACLDYIGLAIELIHSYSLVHDDLPAMDNDDFRRGKPSCHRAFDEATAILIGDAMQALAIELLLEHLPGFITPSQTIAVTRELVSACGAAGMVSGQCLDLTELTANHPVDDMRLSEIHALKTGKLILACVNMVLASTRYQPEECTALQEFAKHFGLAFQMQDDYLDQFASNNHGKKRASDCENQKTTYAALYPKDTLAALVQQHYQQASSAIHIFAAKGERLLNLISMLQERSCHQS